RGRDAEAGPPGQGRVATKVRGVTLALLAFILAAASDWLTVRWHHAREAGSIWMTGLLSCALEALTWVPVYVAIVTQSPWIAVASVLGAGVGTAIGMRRGRCRPGR